MKTIYLDLNYICHVDQSDNYRAYETDAFDGKCDTYIEGYRLIPDGETWTRSDGKIFSGMMVAPAVNYETLVPRQLQYEEDNENMMPLDEVAELVEMIYADDLEVIG